MTWPPTYPDLFAAGEAEYQHHGANRLGANSLVSCIYDGIVAGPSAVAYASGLKTRSEELPASLFEAEVKRQSEINSRLLKKEGKENPHILYQEMGDVMRENVTVVRHNDKLRVTDAKLKELLERYNDINVLDDSSEGKPVPGVRAGAF